MRWFARAEQARVAVEVIVELDWADNIRVYDRARAAVVVLVAIGTRSREEDHFVVLANNDESNNWFELEFFARL